MRKENPQKKKKPNKKQREALRAQYANVFNEGFKMGYDMGLQQAALNSQKMS